MEKSNIATSKKIIQSHVDTFVQKIERLSDDYQPSLRLNNSQWDFKVFRPDNDFPVHAHYEGLLKRYIRECLVSDILFELFQNEQLSTQYKIVKCSKQINLPDPVPISEYSNSMFVEHYPIVFILSDGKERIGLSYFCQPEPIEVLHSLISTYELNSIEVIRFDEEASIPSLQTRFPIKFMTISHFISKYFSKEICETYLQSVKDAIISANNRIGYQSIPLLSVKNISDFKSSVKDALLQVDFTKLEFKQCDLNIMRYRFFNEDMLSTIIGESDFAECFITSEYLYKISQLANHFSFDYTSIVACYFKSIELLLDSIMNLWLTNTEFHNLWINTKERKRKGGVFTPENSPEEWRYKNPQKRSIPQVRFKPGNKEFFKTEMESLIWLVADNPNGWYVSDDTKVKIRKLLLDYKQNCRNDHLHKDLIRNWPLVNTIREKTIQCCFVLLGGCQMTEQLLISDKYLDSNHIVYDRLFKKLMDRSVRDWIWYKIQFGDEKPYLVYRQTYGKQETTDFDNFGHISSELSFICIKNRDELRSIPDELFEEMIKKKPRITLSPNHLPSKIWYITRSNEEIELNWNS